jgi:hypothetical protein
MVDSGSTDSSARVYGCLGSRRISSAGPLSTMRPRYITATRSAMFHARPRSWVTTRAQSPFVGAQFQQQLQDLAPYRGVE